MAINGSPVTIQSIITSEGLSDLRKIVDEVLTIGVKTLKFEPALITSVSRGVKDMEPDPIKYAEALLDVIDYVVKLGVDLKIDTGYFSEPADEYYCGISCHNKIITPSGLITACVEVVRDTEPYADPVIFGKIKGDHIIVDEDKIKILKSLHYENQPECSRCNLRLICKGGCPMSNIWGSGFPTKKSPFTCAVAHRLIPGLLLRMAEDCRVLNVIFDDNVSIKTC